MLVNQRLENRVIRENNSSKKSEINEKEKKNSK